MDLAVDAVILALACASAPPSPDRWPTPADDAAAARLAGAHRYLDAEDAGGPAVRALLGEAGTAARAGEPDARALLSAWILDAEVRRTTREQRTLRDVIARAPDPVDAAGLRAAAVAVTGDPLAAWCAQDAAEGPLDYGAALLWFGVAWQDTDDGRRHLVEDPGASPQARARRARW